MKLHYRKAWIVRSERVDDDDDDDLMRFIYIYIYMDHSLPPSLTRNRKILFFFILTLLRVTRIVSFYDFVCVI